MLLLSTVFMAMTFVVFAINGLFAAAIRDRTISRPSVSTWMQPQLCRHFAALGAKLAFAER